MLTTWDYTALLSPVSPDEVAAFRRDSRSRGLFPAGTSVSSMIAAVVVIVVVSTIVAVVLAGVIGSLLTSAADAPGPLLVIGVLALGAVGIALLVRNASARRWTSLLRLSRFASTNGLLFSSLDPDPTYPGAIFQLGSDRQARDHFRSTSGRYLDFGNYRYTTGSGKNRTTHQWGFLALRLDRALPHMVLDSRGNNGLFGGTNLPVAFQRDQVLSLEGDFDQHFTLYCPREYETDALYVLTPDLMALLIDDASGLDVEIVDDWMFVYSAAPFDTTDPTTVERLRRIVQTVGAKTLSQTERYADERAATDPDPATAGSPLTARMASNTVAPAGRRLRRRVPLLAFVVVAVIIGFQLVRMFSGG